MHILTGYQPVRKKNNAVQMKGEIMADYIRPVVFRLGNQEFGVDINLVQTIEKQINVVPVPNSMKYISGIVNLRGDVIPVMSLKEKFNMENQTSGENTIIVNLPDMKLALEVDEVIEIGELKAEKISPMPKLAKSEGSEYLDRVASVDDKLVILLDINKILSEEEAQGIKEFAEQMKNN